MNIVATNVLWEDGSQFGYKYIYRTLSNKVRVLFLGFMYSGAE